MCLSTRTNTSASTPENESLYIVFVRDAREGHVDAFQTLYRMYEAPLRRTLTRFASATDLEDLLQDVWLECL